MTWSVGLVVSQPIETDLILETGSGQSSSSLHYKYRKDFMKPHPFTRRNRASFTLTSLSAVLGL